MAGSGQQVVAKLEWETGALGPLDLGVPSRPRLVPDREALDRRHDRLAQIVEGAVVPRLVLARRAVETVAQKLPTADLEALAVEVDAFTDILLGADSRAAAAHVLALRERGRTVERLYLDLMAPAARHLGDLWVTDICHFGEVTLGLARLQQVLRQLSPSFVGDVAIGPRDRRVLLAPLPGEQHTFGLFMVADFMRRDGWDVWNGAENGGGDLLRLVRHEWFALVGFSVSRESQLDLTSTSIRAIRRASRNRAVGVMVGGPAFADHPERAALVGADATAIDAQQAAHQARHLVAMLHTAA